MSLLSRLANVFQTNKVNRDLDDELQFHSEQRAAEFIRQGMPPREAASEAQRMLGNSLRTRESSRDVKLLPWLESFVRDVHFGLRMLRKSPIVTASAVGSLAIAIAANTALFTVVNSLLLRPLPYERPGELVEIEQTSEGLPLEELQRARSFTGVASFLPWGFSLSGAEGSQRVFGFRVSANLFEVLGVQAAAGRAFSATEDTAGAQPVMMLSYEYWRRVSGDPAILGQTWTLSDRPYTIVGILPPDFMLWFRDVNVWVADPSPRGRLVARLGPGGALAQAGAEVTGIVQALEPSTGRRGSERGPAVTRLSDAIRPNEAQTLLLLQAAVAFVWLITCANIGNLLLARSSGRRREFALRAALGAGRGQVIRQLLVESSLMAAIGAGIGLGLANLSLGYLNSVLPASVGRGLRGEQALSIDHRVLAFTAGLSLLAVLIFGLAPAVHSLRFNVMSCLRDTAKGAAPGRRRFGQLLVASEICLALMLSVGAGLTLKSLVGLQQQYLGFSAERVLRVTVDLPEARFPLPEQRRIAFDEVLRRVHAIAGVEEAGILAPQFFPFGGPGVRGAAFEINGRPSEEPRAEQYVASPDYFTTVRIPLLKGRLLSNADTPESTPVALISAIVAQRYWGGEDPIGRLIRLQPGVDESPWVMVVGVVGDVRNPIGLDVQPTLYRPLLQSLGASLQPAFRAGDARVSSGVMMIRSIGDPMTLVDAVRAELRQVDPNGPEMRSADLEREVANYVSPQRFVTSLLGSFAGLGLLLAAFGVYGVMRFWVSARIPEIGVRLALGAQPRDVVGLVVRRAARTVLIGVALGVAGAFALQRVIASQLHGVSATDPWVFAAVCAVVAVVAVAAAIAPARAAARVDPLAALRHE
ncbi:MAG: ABC transporter permease [Bryobacterales bacterium]